MDVIRVGAQEVRQPCPVAKPLLLFLVSEPPGDSKMSILGSLHPEGTLDMIARAEKSEAGQVVYSFV